MKSHDFHHKLVREVYNNRLCQFQTEKEALDTWFSQWVKVEEEVFGDGGQFDDADPGNLEGEEDEDDGPDDDDDDGQEDDGETRTVGKKSQGKAGGKGGNVKRAKTGEGVSGVKSREDVKKGVKAILKAMRVEFGRLAGRVSDMEHLIDAGDSDDLAEALGLEASNLPTSAEFPQAGKEGDWLRSQMGDMKELVEGSDFKLIVPILWNDFSKVAMSGDKMASVVSAQDTVERLKSVSKVVDKKRVWPCPYEGCAVVRKSAGGIDSHINQQHTHEVYKCEGCAWTHYNRDMYDTHVKSCDLVGK